MVRQFSAALAAASLLGLASTAGAGPIAVFTQVKDVNGSGSDELRVSGLGTFAVLTTGGGVNPVITVPADRTSASQLVVGFWPVIGFHDRAQYEAQRATVITIPETPVTLYAEVWNGAYGSNPSNVKQVLVDAVISGTLGADRGQNSLDWRFVNPPAKVDFGDALVTLDYAAIPQPDGVPQIQFEDGSPPIGFPGPTYYPTLLEARVSVLRDPNDPGSGGDTGGGGSAPGTPEPASAVLLAGLAAGGFAVRRKVLRGM